MGFPTYFLVVWDYIRFAREKGIPVGPGRGSAAGSLVAYALGITNIDPVQNGSISGRKSSSKKKTVFRDFLVSEEARFAEFLVKTC